jgi:AcrR family transcriptional regulator
MSSDSPASAAAPLSARDRILNVAGRLFRRDGYRAIGVDRVIAEAEVAKATFYKHFPSKDDLIVAWINLAESQSKAGPQAPESATPLSDFAGMLIDVAERPATLGCFYQASAAEYGDMAHPVHQAALGVKQRLIADLTARAARQGLADPQGTAEMVFLLLEGVFAAKRMFGGEAPLAGAKEAVRRLIAPGPQ